MEQKNEQAQKGIRNNTRKFVLKIGKVIEGRRNNKLLFHLVTLHKLILNYYLAMQTQEPLK